MQSTAPSPHGFSDVQDDDLLCASEVAQRLGYQSWRAARRWLLASGLPLPPCLRRSWFRGDHLKWWFARLPAQGQKVIPAALPPVPSVSGEVIDLDTARQRARDRA